MSDVIFCVFGMRNQRLMSPIFFVPTCKHKIPILNQYTNKDAKLLETSARPLKVKVWGILKQVSTDE